MKNIKYYIFLILIIILNSILLSKKIRHIENFLIKTENKKQKDNIINLQNKEKNTKEEVSKTKQNIQIGFSELANYFTNEKKKSEEAREEIIKNIRENNPLNKFKHTNNVACKDIHINISDNISSNLGNSDLIKKTCAKECHNNPKCLSFDYSNKKCRLSTWCIKDIGEKKTNSSIYQDKTKPIPNITKFKLYPKKKNVW